MGELELYLRGARHETHYSIHCYARMRLCKSGTLCSTHLFFILGPPLQGRQLLGNCTWGLMILTPYFLMTAQCCETAGRAPYREGPQTAAATKVSFSVSE